jgi:hypothetical protein
MHLSLSGILSSQRRQRDRPESQPQATLDGFRCSVGRSSRRLTARDLQVRLLIWLHPGEGVILELLLGLVVLHWHECWSGLEYKDPHFTHRIGKQIHFTSSTCPTTIAIWTLVVAGIRDTCFSISVCVWETI